jgi:hypothetical protein
MTRHLEVVNWYDGSMDTLAPMLPYISKLVNEYARQRVEFKQEFDQNNIYKACEKFPDGLTDAVCSHGDKNYQLEFIVNRYD